MSIEYTNEYIKEHIKCKESPLYFIEEYCKIINPYDGLVNISLTIKQVSLLYKHIKNKMIIDDTDDRQVGNTTIHTLYSLWLMIFNPNSIVAMSNIKYSGNSHARDMFKTAYINLPDFLKPEIIKNNKLNIIFENGSELILKNSDPCQYKAVSFSHVILDDYEFYTDSYKEGFEEYSYLFYRESTARTYIL